MQAGNNFKGGISSQKVEMQKDGDEVHTVTINFDCSQEILDALVNAIYARKVELNADNVADILSLADFLQASCTELSKCVNHSPGGF